MLPAFHTMLQRSLTVKSARFITPLCCYSRQRYLQTSRFAANDLKLNLEFDQLPADTPIERNGSKRQAATSATEHMNSQENEYPEENQQQQRDTSSGESLSELLHSVMDSTKSFKPKDPYAQKRNKRVESIIERRLLELVQRSRFPHKKKNPLPRAMIAPIYGHQGPTTQGTRTILPWKRPQTSDLSLAERDKENKEISAIVTCQTSPDLLLKVVQIMNQMEADNYPRYYPNLLLRSIQQAAFTLLDPYLALSIFEQAKSRSTMSYIYGCTVEVYNAILLMRWRLWRDVHGMSSLVEEMMLNGVGFDDQTRSIVRLAVEEVENELRFSSEHLEEEDSLIWSADERRSANLMKVTVGKWMIK